jgi:PIN domain nuclease of toxin-antitoxin system
VSLWEFAIKYQLTRDDIGVDPRLLRRSLLDNGYTEIHVTSEHAVAIDALPPIHKDPFDRLLIAQAMVQGITLLTADKILSRYPGPVRKV